jgi:hypothetical protein
MFREHDFLGQLADLASGNRLIVFVEDTGGDIGI